MHYRMKIYENILIVIVKMSFLRAMTEDVRAETLNTQTQVDATVDPAVTFLYQRDHLHREPLVSYA